MDAWRDADMKQSLGRKAQLLSENKPSNRMVGFTFRGLMGRRHEGKGRGVLQSLASHLESADIRNVSFKRYSPNMTSDTAKAYLNSNFCFVPAGDTPTSRRLFDAVAAGCVPVVLGSFDHLVANLPFSRSIDWTQILLFSGTLQCVGGDLERSAIWLQSVSNEFDSVTRIREAGREVFRGALSYTRGTGLVTALLHELAHELVAVPAR
jgi:hypothetical protein